MLKVNCNKLVKQMNFDLIISLLPFLDRTLFQNQTRLTNTFCYLLLFFLQRHRSRFTRSNLIFDFLSRGFFPLSYDGIYLYSRIKRLFWIHYEIIQSFNSSSEYLFYYCILKHCYSIIKRRERNGKSIL